MYTVTNILGEGEMAWQCSVFKMKKMTKKKKMLFRINLCVYFPHLEMLESN